MEIKIYVNHVANCCCPGNFHRFLFPYTFSSKFPNLNFAPYVLYIYSCYLKPVQDKNSEPDQVTCGLSASASLHVYSLHLSAFEGAMHVQKNPAGQILSYTLSAYFFY